MSLSTCIIGCCIVSQGRSGSYVWLILGLPLIVLSHVVVMCVTWLLVISIGTAKVSNNVSLSISKYLCHHVMSK